MSTPIKENVAKARIRFAHELTMDPFVQNHLYNTVWISGENTDVYPISMMLDTIILQWNSNRACKSWIQKTVDKHKNILKHGYFDKTDNSCPARVCFVFKDDYKAPLFWDCNANVQINPNAVNYDELMNNLRKQNINIVK